MAPGRLDDQRERPTTGALALATGATLVATVAWVFLHDRLEGLNPTTHLAVSITYPLIALAFVRVISRSAMWTWFNILVAASAYHVFVEWAL
ncbi:hypothetical protein [Aeromicrobium massiliense]|uniref:hypothetical protein n=1 Tax=Aeromicrobium massiliense TaxID=1464554 RepID=UPI0005787030|nr:hypothetical protein [Aeromicrobium massiliense]